jgi:hypothetical protein
MFIKSFNVLKSKKPIDSSEIHKGGKITLMLDDMDKGNGLIIFELPNQKDVIKPLIKWDYKFLKEEWRFELHIIKANTIPADLLNGRFNNGDLRNVNISDFDFILFYDVKGNDKDDDKDIKLKFMAPPGNGSGTAGSP